MIKFIKNDIFQLKHLKILYCITKGVRMFDFIERESKRRAVEKILNDYRNFVICHSRGNLFTEEQKDEHMQEVVDEIVKAFQELPC